MMEFLELQNTEDKTIVDLACGTGATSIFAPKLFKTVYAVDVSEAMIECREKNVLYVSEIDVLDNTPLIDIKPYLPRFDYR